MTDKNDRDRQPYDDEGQTPGPKRMGERLLSLLIIGTILLNFPLLSIFSVNTLFLGFPVLYAYLFAVWCLLIAAMALVLRDRPPGQAGPDGAAKTEDH